MIPDTPPHTPCANAVAIGICGRIDLIDRKKHPRNDTAEEEAKKLNEGSRAASNKKPKKEQPQKDADVLSFEQELKNIFGTKSINLKGDINKGSIVIGFDTRKDFDRIYDVLMSKR